MHASATLQLARARCRRVSTSSALAGSRSSSPSTLWSPIDSREPHSLASHEYRTAGSSHPSMNESTTRIQRRCSANGVAPMNGWPSTALLRSAQNPLKILSESIPNARPARVTDLVARSSRTWD